MRQTIIAPRHPPLPLSFPKFDTVLSERKRSDGKKSSWKIQTVFRKSQNKSTTARTRVNLCRYKSTGSILSPLPSTPSRYAVVVVRMEFLGYSARAPHIPARRAEKERERERKSERHLVSDAGKTDKVWKSRGRQTE